MNRHSSESLNPAPTTLQQVLIQAAPERIRPLDQRDLPWPLPFLDRLLPPDGRGHGVMQLIPYQGVHLVLFGKPLDEIVLVLPDPAHQIRGHADV
jgi:hypothetical protein